MYRIVVPDDVELMVDVRVLITEKHESDTAGITFVDATQAQHEACGYWVTS